MNKVITEISAPVLNDSNFGNNLKDQFENINNNFKILASAEFMKGAEGKTIKLSKAPAFEKNTEGKYIFTLWGAKLFSAILGITINEDDLLNVIEDSIEDNYPQWKKLSKNAKYSVFDSFKTGDEYNGTINLYSYEDEYGKEAYVYSPMNYFRDARIDELNDSESKVSNFSDASCSYIYDGEKFKTYTLYPTLYYNSTLGLICWKVNGEETSIAAQGLKGKDGNTCSVHLLKCIITELGDDLMSIQATRYFYPGKDESKWYDISETVSVINENEKTKYNTISDIFKKTDLYFCIIYGKDENNNDVYDYTFANYPSIDDSNNTVKFIIDNSALIGRKAFINNFRDMINNFSHGDDGYPNAASLKGFYLPFSSKDKNLVHSIYVSSENINNNERSILNIDVESKDIYTNNDTDKNEGEIEKGSINIKNHDVKIVGESDEDKLTLTSDSITSEKALNLNSSKEEINLFNNTSDEAKVNCFGNVHINNKNKLFVKDIWGVDDVLNINAAKPSNNNIVGSININNFKNLTIGGEGSSNDRDIIIKQDTTLNVDGLSCLPYLNTKCITVFPYYLSGMVDRTNLAYMYYMYDKNSDGNEYFNRLSFFSNNNKPLDLRLDGTMESKGYNLLYRSGKPGYAVIYYDSTEDYTNTIWFGSYDGAPKLRTNGDMIAKGLCLMDKDNDADNANNASMWYNEYERDSGENEGIVTISNNNNKVSLHTSWKIQAKYLYIRDLDETDKQVGYMYYKHGRRTTTNGTVIGGNTIHFASYIGDVNLFTGGKLLSAGGTQQVSDERLKDFHGDIEIDFDKLKKIPKKYFTWKSGDEKKLHIGTSAQEVQKVYPEIVSGDDTLSVSYDKFGVIALKAIDILHDDLEELKKENNELKAKNQELESRLAKLESLITQLK